MSPKLLGSRVLQPPKKLRVAVQITAAAPEIPQKLIEQLKTGKVTLVYGAKDEEHNDAMVLKEYLEKK